MEIPNMRLTRFTDYSLRVLIYLAKDNENRITIQQISDAYDISKNHLMKVVSNLTRLGFVVAQRGPGGGIKLNRSPEEIGLDDVIGKTEKNLQNINLSKEPAQSESSADNKLNLFLQHALQAYLAELSHFTLADVLAPESNVSQILELKRKAA
jgi:Rrf2 family nitric oxide-sensitive transcriptional repressor